MQTGVDLKYCMSLAPARAIEYLRQKGYQLSDDWQDVWQEAHTKAFTVAKVTRLDILQDIRTALQKSLDEGKTAKWFEKELTPVLQRKGWWGKKEAIDPDTGEITIEQLGSPYRLQTIYQTNLQTAYMAGRYTEQVDNSDDRPYWMYVCVDDGNTRPEHWLMHKKVYHYTDPIWDKWYPPNGWGCRCRVVALSADDVKRMGLTISSSVGKAGTYQELISKKTGELKEVATLRVVDPRTGKQKIISPDAGWSYNPGRAWKPNLGRYSGELADLARREL